MRLNNRNQLGITLLLINASIYIAFSLYSPFLSAYYSKSGLNAVEIGILLTIGPIIAIFIQPFWAIISDKSGRRKLVLSLVILGSAFSLFSYYIGHSFVSFFIASTLSAVFSTSIIPLNDAITLRLARKNNLDFSIIRMGGTVGFAIVVLIAGAIVKKDPNIQFVLGFFGFMVLLFFVSKIPKEEKEKTDTHNNVSSLSLEKKKTGFFNIFESRQVYFMLAFAFITQVGLSFHGSFMGVYALKLGSSEDMIALINCLAALSEIPVLFLINKLLRKVSTMKLIAFSSVLLGLRMFIVTAGGIEFVLFAQFLHGLTYMTVYYSIAVYISKKVKSTNQSKGQSALTIVQTGLGSIVGNIIGGYLVDRFGLIAAYQYMGALIIIISLMIVTLQLLYRSATRERD
jgi:Major Facilitator Superfamily.